MSTDESRIPGAGPAAAEGQQQADPRRWLALIVLSLAQLMDILDGTVINIALPSAQRDLGFSVDYRQYLVTGYALAYGSLLLFGGRLSDRFGRRRLFVVGLVGFGVCSAVGGASVNFGMLLTARIAQGVFAAALAPAALSLVSVTFADSPSERGRAFGVFGAVSGMGGAVGLVLGGYLVDALSWRWCLYINVAIAAITLLGAAAFIRDREPRTGILSLDLPGAFTIAAGLAGVSARSRYSSTCPTTCSRPWVTPPSEPGWRSCPSPPRSSPAPGSRVRCCRGSAPASCSPSAA